MSITSYTDETLCNAVYESLRARGVSVEPSVIPRLVTQIPLAQERVATTVAISPDRRFRNLLRKSLGTITVASGVASFSTLLTGNTPILLNNFAVRSADIRTAGGQKLQILPDRASLDQDRPSAFLYGAVEGTNLYTDAPDGSLTVIANYIQTVTADFPTELIPMLFAELEGQWTKAA